MSTHSFQELKDIIRQRLDLIEKGRDKFDFQDEDHPENQTGRIVVTYGGKTYVTFLYMVTNIRKPNGKVTVRGSFTIKCQAYPEWYQQYLEKGTKDVVHISEFFEGHSTDNDRHDLNYFLDYYLPVGKAEEKDKIADTFKDYGLKEDDITFDTIRKCYLVSIDLKKALDPEKTDSEESLNKAPQDYSLFKYTSLSAFLSMLNNKTFRMNSIISMNDIYESEWMEHLLYGTSEITDEQLKLTYVENKNVLITSFAGKGDDASMWRLYGKKGNGVCLCFSCPSDKITKIIYASENDEQFKALHKKVGLLKGDGINVRFVGTDKMRYFIKSSSFSIENEYRYLYDAREEQLNVADYDGLLSTYKDFPIHPKDGTIKGLPFKLEGVYIGHNIPNYNTNISLLVSQIHEIFPSLWIYESRVKEVR